MKLLVVGMPITQGNKKARVVNGRAIMTEGWGKGPQNLKDWRNAIADAARAYLTEHNMPAPLDEPLALEATFYLPRPKTAPKTRLYPDKKPDCDKLCRAVGDALSGVAYVDDARIVTLRVHKRFAVDSPPRVEITLRAVHAFD
jgi:crossover junction endodeoxyribonuclease RusA